MYPGAGLTHVRRLSVLVLLLVTTVPALAADEPCEHQTESGDHVCWNGSTDSEVEQSTAAGTVHVATYTDAREGGDEVDYTATRDGVTVGLDGLVLDVQQVRYTGTADDKVVRFEEVRVDAAGRQGAVGLRRTSYGAVDVCDVYVADESVEAPCSPLFP